MSSCHPYVVGSLVLVRWSGTQTQAAVVLGASRAAGKLRVKKWRNASKRWTAALVIPESDVVGYLPKTDHRRRRIGAYVEHIPEAIP